MGKKIGKLVLLIAVLLGISYIAYFGIGKDKYGSAEDIKLGLDLNGGLSITFQTVEENPSSQDMKDTIYKLQKRVEKYSTEANVYQEGDNRINVEIPLKSTDMASAKAILDDLGQPGSLEFVDVDENVIITGSDIKDAEAMYTTNNTTGSKKYLVSLTLTEEGAEKFAEGTRRVSQKTNTNDKKIAIVYDGKQISNPICEKEITGGEVSIDNMESYEAADTLATYIRIGAIPLELTTLRSNIVAPELGSNAIDTSLMAALIGIILIIVFMIAYYRIPGLASSIALIIYIGLVIFAVSAFEVTLTLPGIAGIVLSIGMAVDANVIIFARIREELANGYTVETAIKNGFDKAFSAIFDGNITTLIAAVVLYALGSGTVKGFAVTLAIGIILSMFTAIVVTKFIVKLFFQLGANKPSLYGMQKPKKIFNFMKKKVVYLLISLALIAVGVVAMIINGVNGKGVFNFSIEFVGGSSTSVTFNEALSQSEIENDVVPVIKDIIGIGTIQTQRVEGSTEVVFKTKELTAEQGEKISKALEEKYSVDPKKITSESISSTVSKEMQRDAIISLSVAMVAILLYIWVRFRNIRFATSAIIALLHDVLVVVAFYAVARIPMGNTFIACILTIVGYSINATIVIFDRIREDVKTKAQKENLSDVVNRSVTSTLSRSINTSITTGIMLVMLFILGVTSIREFSLPLIVGVICGAYSSVCVSGSLWHTFMMKFPPKSE